MSGFDLLRAVRDMPPPTQPKLSATDKAVLVAIVMRLGDDGTCFPSLARLARDTWASRRTVQDCVRRLNEAGVIKITTRRREGSNERDSNVYSVCVPVEQSAQAPLIAADDTPPTPGPAPARSERGTRLPPDWSPSAEVVAWAREQDVDALAALAEFRDYWTAVPGAKGLKLDWNATFRNSLRKLMDQGRASKLPPADWTPSPELPVNGTEAGVTRAHGVVAALAAAKSARRLEVGNA